jgi:hypothetical protein
MDTLPDFLSMNETDVREIIVRTLLERLGYRHGTEATIRMEQTLTYARCFLGRKNPKKDPPLIGRADYICDVISFGRWVVEVKGPGEDLTRDTVEQAHTYAAHPEIAAWFFLVTNGRRFQLYQTGVLANAMLDWTYEEMDDILLKLFNIVSPAAMKKRSKLAAADPGKPLGRGLASKLRIIGGEILYEDHEGDHPFFTAESINGLRLPVTGGSVQRGNDGRILGHVDVAKAIPLMRELNQAMGLADGYDFLSATEYLSDDPEHPSIFQNLVQTTTPAGTLVSIPGLGNFPVPFEMSFSAFTEAVGFVDSDKFVGTIRLIYELNFSKMPAHLRYVLEARLGKIPPTAQVKGAGRFEVTLLADC